jgi:uncharacterized protein YjiS (DUF1127 family)
MSAIPGFSFKRLWATLRLWRRRGLERDELALLDGRSLHDLGLSSSTIFAELQKPFWQE